MLENYSRATDAYGKGAAHAIDQRQMEANALLKAARQLEEVRKEWNPGLQRVLDDAVLYNRKLWTVFAAEAANDGHELSIEIKNNIANISLFVFKRSLELQAVPSPEKIDALVEINKNIAAGLLAKPDPSIAAPGKAETYHQRSADV
jgi:flagellar protein FlaF